MTDAAEQDLKSESKISDQESSSRRKILHVRTAIDFITRFVSSSSESSDVFEFIDAVDIILEVMSLFPRGALLRPTGNLATARRGKGVGVAGVREVGGALSRKERSRLW